MRPKAFRSPAAFRAWLQRHHASTSELNLRLYKVAFRDKGIGYREALDEALCIGWIDGVRRALDAESFTQRFSPRKAKSYWSAINTRRFRELEREGRVRPPGLAAFRARVNGKGSSRYSFESRPVTLSRPLRMKLRANARAWTFFQAQPPWYRRITSFYVMSAKQEATRERRLATLIRDSAAGRRIGLLGKPAAKPRQGAGRGGRERR